MGFIQVADRLSLFLPVVFPNLPIPDINVIERSVSASLSSDTSSSTQSPVSTSSTLASSAALDIHKLQIEDPDKHSPETENHSRFTRNYPDAYTDTYGTVSGQPFVYKTGSPWPKRANNHDTTPFRREIRPVNNHPITDSWVEILTDVEAYLEEVGQAFTAIMGLGFANQKDPLERGDPNPPFCPLVMTIGVEPKTIAFEDARSIAENVKANILSKAGFPDIDVAIWVFTTTFMAGPYRGAKLPAYDPRTTGKAGVAEFHRPFTSVLGLPIAMLKNPETEGTAGLYLKRNDNGKKEIFALTAAHVVNPPPALRGNKNVPERAANAYKEPIIAPGSALFTETCEEIDTRIETLDDNIKSMQANLTRLKENWTPQADDRPIQQVEEALNNAQGTKQALEELRQRITRDWRTPADRCIGQLWTADSIGNSSDKPDAWTRDWALIKLREDAFETEKFQGNKIYIGDLLSRPQFDWKETMFPDARDHGSYQPPQGGLLKIQGIVPMDEILKPCQLDTEDGKKLVVIKNGRSTGTTIGQTSGLQAITRHYNYLNGLQFRSLEIVVVSYSIPGPFSGGGDSGSIIVDRSGRLVGLLTGGGGITDRTDITFATPYCELSKRIQEVVPGIHLYD